MFTIAPEKIIVIPNAKGQPAGVLLDMQTWDSILEALELAEDLPVIKKALAKINAAGGESRRTRASQRRVRKANQ